MGRRRHTPEQIITVPREAEVGLARGKTAAMVSRELGISEQTYYRWRKEFGGMRVDQERRLKELERENAHLGPVNTKGQFVVYWGYEDHRVPISSDRGLLPTSARQCEPLQSRSA